MEKRHFPLCQCALLALVCLINAAEGSLLMQRLYWFYQTLWLQMNGSHILSQLRNSSLHICDISTTDGCNFQSDTTHPLLFYFHPLIFFFILAFTHYAPFYFHPCPFLSFCSWLLPVIRLLWIFSSVLLIFFPPIIWYFFNISFIYRLSLTLMHCFRVLFLFTCSANF